MDIQKKTTHVHVLFSVLFAYCLLCFSILCHEWAHSLTAVIFGVKSQVFDIHYSALPFFIGIHENVDYARVAGLPQWQGILISFAGLCANFLLASGALIIIIGFPGSRFLKSYWSALACCVLAFWNANEWVGYMVTRNIFPSGDIAHMVAFGVPRTPLLIFGILTSAGFLSLIFVFVRRYFGETFLGADYAPRELLKTFIIIFVIHQAVVVCFF